MTYQNLDAWYSAKKAALGAIRFRVDTMEPAQTAIRTTENGWSIAGIVEHLHIVEGQILQLVISLTGKTEQAGRTGGPTAIISLPPSVLHAAGGKLVTREKFRPTGTISAPESVDRLNGIQEELGGLRPRLQRIDLTFATFPHWAFGPLSLGEWLAFMVLHEQRHLAQIESIIASPAFGSSAPSGVDN